MSLVFRKPSTNGAALSWHSIDVAGNSFEVSIRRPTWGELSDDMEQPGGFIGRRVALVQNWRGVTDEDGQPVEFSQDRLKQLCEMFPAVLSQIAAIGGNFFSGLGETAQGNSGGPSGDRSNADTPTANSQQLPNTSASSSSDSSPAKPG